MNTKYFKDTGSVKKISRIKKSCCIFIVLALCFVLTACAAIQSGKSGAPLPVKVLILPKFEVGELSGDFPGEAQLFYENYFTDSEAFEIAGTVDGSKLYYKDGLAMYVLGEGKVNSAASLTSILLDSRLDFSNACFMTVGCGGGAYERSVIGDIVLITGVADFDAGHRVDIRELKDDRENGWFKEDDFDQFSHVVLNQGLADELYSLIKDIRPQLPSAAKEYMANNFDNAAWAVRDPMVLKGSSVTSDCYWKGQYLSREATVIAESYGLPDPFMITEMEDIAIGVVLDRAGLLDRYIGLRVNVNMDVFTGSMTPENTWGDEVEETLLADDETAGCFQDNMKNLFEVSNIVIDYLMNK
jgi:purine nucleoside permease